MEKPHQPNHKEIKQHDWILASKLKVQQRQNQDKCLYQHGRAQSWNPNQKELLQKIEMIQRRAASYVSNRFRNTSSISWMLDALQWESLESRRTKIQLTLLFKIINDLVDIRADDYLASSTGRTRQSLSKKYRQISTRTDSYKFSFFPRTIPVWNSLPASVAEAPSLVSVKKGLSPYPSKQC